MIVISQSLVLSPVTEPEAHLPVIGWRNVITPANVSTDEEDPLFPAVNLANPSTALQWRGLTAVQQHVTVTFSTVTYVDYFAVAQHNFGSAGIGISVEGLFGGEWELLGDELIPADDRPIMWRFPLTAPEQIRLRMRAGSALPRLAVPFCGRLTVCEVGIQVGYTPLPYGRVSNVVTGRSESGNFLGRITTGRSLQSTANLAFLPPDWARAELDPFLEAAIDQPFFFAWDPENFPKEVGLAWLMNDPQPDIHLLTGHMQVTLEMGGVA
jgi:hypothetical protein